VVLDGRSDEVVAWPHHPEEREIVALGPATGKDDFCGPAVYKISYTFAGLLDSGARLLVAENSRMATALARSHEALGGPLPRVLCLSADRAEDAIEAALPREGGEFEAVALEDGMVLCVETPYYQIGWGGMMVEDMIVIRPSGNECLTHLPRELRRL